MASTVVWIQVEYRGMATGGVRWYMASTVVYGEYRGTQGRVRWYGRAVSILRDKSKNPQMS